MNQLYVHPSTFCASVVPSINFRQLSVHPLDLPSTFLASVRPSIKFLCDCGTFLKPPSTFVHPQYLPSTSINLPCISGTFHELKSTFRASMGDSVDFRKAAGPSVKFPCNHRTIHLLSECLQDLLLTFRISAGHFANFPHACSTFRELPPTFPCVRGTIH